MDTKRTGSAGPIEAILAFRGLLEKSGSLPSLERDSVVAQGSAVGRKIPGQGEAARVVSACERARGGVTRWSFAADQALDVFFERACRLIRQRVERGKTPFAEVSHECADEGQDGADQGVASPQGPAAALVKEVDAHGQKTGDARQKQGQANH